MPSLDWCPRFFAMTAADFRAWSATPLFSRGGVVVSMPTFTSPGAGIFTDILDAMDSRRGGWDGAGAAVTDFADLANDIAVRWTAAGGGATVWTCGIDANDRVWVQSSAITFDIDAPQLGFNGWTAAAGGGPFRATATGEWVRGQITLTFGVGYAQVRSLPGVAAFDVTLAAQSRTVQSVPAWLRPYTTADADSPAWATFAQADRATLNYRYIHWGINSSGHVVASWPSAGALGAFVWLSTTFRDRLGFSGSETIPAGDVARLVADYPCPGVLAPSRPLLEPLVRYRDELASQSRTLGSTVSRVTHSPLLGWAAVMAIDGPLDYGDDLWDHYLRRWLPYVDAGVCLALEAGDTRRRGVLYSGQTYSTLRTMQDDGLHGRIVGRLAPDHSGRQELLADNGLYRRAPVTLRIVEVP